MRHVRISVEIAEDRYTAYESEARRQGTTVEALVQQVVKGLLSELQQEELDGTDHPILL